MAQQLINVGTIANDGTGDPLRNAYIKINDNFTELYARPIGDMVLADVQTNVGAKTFLDDTLLLRNVANTFSSKFTNTNAAARVYTLPDASGTVALTSDIVYPAAGIAVSNGSAWVSSITDNSANWNTAFGWGDHAGLYWSLASGATLTNVNTVTSNTANWLNFDGTWTATANNQANATFGGSFTSRNTASDEIYGYRFNPTLISDAGNPVNLIRAGLIVDPSFSGPLTSSSVNLAIYTKASVLIGTPLTNNTALTISAAGGVFGHSFWGNGSELSYGIAGISGAINMAFSSAGIRFITGGTNIKFTNGTTLFVTSNTRTIFSVTEDNANAQGIMRFFGAGNSSTSAANQYISYLNSTTNPTGGAANAYITYARDNTAGNGTSSMVVLSEDGVASIFGAQVGIATVTPTANTRLDIRGTGTTTNIALRIADSSNAVRFTYLDNGSFTFNTGTASKFISYTAATSLFNIESTNPTDLVLQTKSGATVGFSATAGGDLTFSGTTGILRSDLLQLRVNNSEAVIRQSGDNAGAHLVILAGGNSGTSTYNDVIFRSASTGTPREIGRMLGNGNWTMPVSGSVLTLGGGATASELRFLEPSGGGTSYIGFKSPALAANTVYDLPNAFPAVSGYVLSSTTAGVMSWVAAGGGGWATTGTTNLTGGTTIDFNTNSLVFVGDAGNQFNIDFIDDPSNYAQTVFDVGQFSISTNATGDTETSFKVRSTPFGGTIFTDGKATKTGIEYAATGYVTTNRSLTDKEYVDNAAADGITAFGWGDHAGAGYLVDPMTTRGDILIRNASNITARLGVGANTYVLTSNGTDVSWAAPSGGGITNGAAANELMKSNGTNAVASGIFSTSAGNIDLGTGIAGNTREINATGSDSNIGIQFTQKGTGNISFVRTSVTAARFVFTTANLNLVGGSADNTTPHTFEISTPSGTGGATNTGNIYLNPGTEFSGGASARGSILLGSASAKIGFFGVAGVIKQSAVTTSQGIADVLTAYGLLPTSTISGGGGITNGAANTELMVSNGTNAIGGKIFSPSNGNLTLGDGSLAGSRTIAAVNSTSNATLSITAENGMTLSTTSGVLSVGSFVSIYSSTLAYISSGATLQGQGALNINSVGALNIGAVTFSVGVANDIQITAGSVQAAATQAGTLFLSGGATSVNGVDAGHVFIAGGTSTGTGLEGNIGLFTGSVANWQTMERGLFIGDSLAAPTGNPASGAFMYGVSGDLRWRSSGGSVYTLKNEKTLVLVVGDGSAIATGGKTKTRIIAPYTGVIKRWKLITDQSATVTLDVWKHTAIPTNANTITAAAKPSTTAAEFNSSSTLTGWTTAVTEGDILQLEVEANDNATYISLMLVMEVTT